MQQGKIESFIEQLFNVGTGFILAFYTWDWLLKPLINQGVIEIENTFIITTIFTIISLLRGFFWRRAFDKKIPRRIVEWAKTHRITQWLLSYVK